MNEKNAHETGTVLNLIFACSGAADVGAVADQAARKLARDGAGKMYCLAGIGGRVPGIMSTARSAQKILVIDGCNQNCALKTLEQAGFKSYTHLKLTDLGMEKGNSPATIENIEKAAARGEALLTNK